jgi:nitrite reductase (NO-forming)
VDGLSELSTGLVRETVPPADKTEMNKVGRVRHTATAARKRVPLGSVVRIAFGLIWLADAYFKWQPSFVNGIQGVMHDGMVGQPGWLKPWFQVNHAVIASQPTLWAYTSAAVETAIAVALIFGLLRKVTYVGGAAWSLLIWSTAEGFGHLPSGVD